MRTPLALIIAIVLAACGSNPVAPTPDAVPEQTSESPARSDMTPWIPARWASDTLTVAG